MYGIKPIFQTINLQVPHLLAVCFHPMETQVQVIAKNRQNELIQRHI